MSAVSALRAPAFEAAEAICRVADPFDWTPEKTRTMVAACRENALFHYAHNADIRALYDRRGFDPRSIASEEDLARIPALGVTAMKHFLLHTLPEEQAVLRLTSSGTRGQKTQIWFDQGSLDRGQAQLTGLFVQEKLVSNQSTHYLCFNYDPREAHDLGIAFTDQNQQRFAPAARVHYTIRKNAQGEWASRTEDTIAVLRDFASDVKPVRIFAMPAFLYETLSRMGEQSLSFALPEGSLVLTGGGWKAAEDKQISREAFRALIGERLGVHDASIRDGFGLAEHAAPYIECRAHRFHVAAYNRVLVRDPVTLAVLPAGRPGLLEFITPFNAMMPNLAVLATDSGVLDPSPCTCGWNAPTFTLLGRAGITKHKGCALTAGDIVRRDAGQGRSSS